MAKLSDLKLIQSITDDDLLYVVDDNGVVSKGVKASELKNYTLLTAVEIKTLYESNADTNAFNDSNLANLNSLEGRIVKLRADVDNLPSGGGGGGTDLSSLSNLPEDESVLNIYAETGVEGVGLTTLFNGTFSSSTIGATQPALRFTSSNPSYKGIVIDLFDRFDERVLTEINTALIEFTDENASITLPLIIRIEGVDYGIEALDTLPSSVVTDIRGGNSVEIGLIDSNGHLINFYETRPSGLSNHKVSTDRVKQIINPTLPTDNPQLRDRLSLVSNKRLDVTLVAEEIVFNQSTLIGFSRGANHRTGVHDAGGSLTPDLPTINSLQTNPNASDRVEIYRTKAIDDQLKLKELVIGNVKYPLTEAAPDNFWGDVLSNVYTIPASVFDLQVGTYVKLNFTLQDDSYLSQDARVNDEFQSDLSDVKELLEIPEHLEDLSGSDGATDVSTFIAKQGSDYVQTPLSIVKQSLNVPEDTNQDIENLKAKDTSLTNKDNHLQGEINHIRETEAKNEVVLTDLPTIYSDLTGDDDVQIQIHTNTFISDDQIKAAPTLDEIVATTNDRNQLLLEISYDPLALENDIPNQTNSYAVEEVDSNDVLVRRFLLEHFDRIVQEADDENVYTKKIYGTGDGNLFSLPAGNSLRIVRALHERGIQRGIVKFDSLDKNTQDRFRTFNERQATLQSRPSNVLLFPIGEKIQRTQVVDITGEVNKEEFEITTGLIREDGERSYYGYSVSNGGDALNRQGGTTKGLPPEIIAIAFEPLINSGHFRLFTRENTPLLDQLTFRAVATPEVANNLTMVVADIDEDRDGSHVGFSSLTVDRAGLQAAGTLTPNPNSLVQIIEQLATRSSAVVDIYLRKQILTDLGVAGDGDLTHFITDGVEYALDDLGEPVGNLGNRGLREYRTASIPTWSIGQNVEINFRKSDGDLLFGTPAVLGNLVTIPITRVFNDQTGRNSWGLIDHDTYNADISNSNNAALEALVPNANSVTISGLKFRTSGGSFLEGQVLEEGTQEIQVTDRIEKRILNEHQKAEYDREHKSLIPRLLSTDHTITIPIPTSEFSGFTKLIAQHIVRFDNSNNQRGTGLAIFDLAIERKSLLLDGYKRLTTAGNSNGIELKLNSFDASSDFTIENSSLISNISGVNNRLLVGWNSIVLVTPTVAYIKNVAKRLILWNPSLSNSFTNIVNQISADDLGDMTWDTDDEALCILNQTLHRIEYRNIGNNRVDKFIQLPAGEYTALEYLKAPSDDKPYFYVQDGTTIKRVEKTFGAFPIVDFVMDCRIVFQSFGNSNGQLFGSAEQRDRIYKIDLTKLDLEFWGKYSNALSHNALGFLGGEAYTVESNSQQIHRTTDFQNKGTITITSYNNHNKAGRSTGANGNFTITELELRRV